MRPRRNLTLIDLMAAVVAAALCLAWVVSAARGRAGPSMIVIGPLIGFVPPMARWQGPTRWGARWGGLRGRRPDLARHRPTQAWRDRALEHRELARSNGHHDDHQPRRRDADGIGRLARGGHHGTIVKLTLPTTNDRFVRKS
jgi:hypothetical protein